MTNIKWCIEYLKDVNHIKGIIDSNDEVSFRALLNITMPVNLSDEFYKRQDNILQEILSRKQIIDASLK